MIVKETILKLTALLLFSLWVTDCIAQFSHDGNRWYEIEMSVFSNEYPADQSAELWTPERLNLAYPEKFRQLSAVSDAITFSAVQADQDESNLYDIMLGYVEPALGPEFSPPPYEYKFPNIETDAFLKLGSEHSSFKKYHQRLKDSGLHRILFTAQWRQPVLAKNEAMSLLISGGEKFDDHFELEGNILISFLTNRIVLDTDLWLSTFTTDESETKQPWKLPDDPSVESEQEAAYPRIEFYAYFNSGISAQKQSGLYNITQIVTLTEQRKMVSNKLYYLDHPAFGLIIRVKPYFLPDIFENENMSDESTEITTTDSL